MSRTRAGARGVQSTQAAVCTKPDEPSVGLAENAFCGPRGRRSAAGAQSPSAAGTAGAAALLPRASSPPGNISHKAIGREQREKASTLSLLQALPPKARAGMILALRWDCT